MARRIGAGRHASYPTEGMVTRDLRQGWGRMRYALGVNTVPLSDARRFIEPWSILALAVLVLAAYGPALTVVPPPLRLSLTGLGMAYLASTVAGAMYLERTGPSTRAALFVFGVQIAIAGLSGALSEGRTLLSPLATASLAVLYLKTLGRTIVLGAVMTTFVVAMLAYAPSPSVAAQAIISLTSALAFVVAFSQMALSRHRARCELEHAHAQLRAQSHDLAALAVERERVRIAREIHDSVGHWLSSIHIHLETAVAVATDDVAHSTSAIKKAQGATRSALAEVRASVTALRSPEETLTRPLRDAFVSLTRDTEALGMNVAFDVQLGHTRLPARVEFALFRIAQEALTNVRRHAHARHVAVGLRADDHRFTLTIEDDGVGLVDSSADEGDAGGCGLLGIRERAAAVGAQCRIHSPPEGGVRIEIVGPS